MRGPAELGDHGGHAGLEGRVVGLQVFIARRDQDLLVVRVREVGAVDHGIGQTGLAGVSGCVESPGMKPTLQSSP